MAVQVSSGMPGTPPAAHALLVATQPMITRSPIACALAIALTGGIACADTVIEGHVELPKATTVAVVNKRYQVVTKGGDVTINPPQGVVYLEGNFSKPAGQPVAQMVQKNLA